jgi:hypothetical protein
MARPPKKRTVNRTFRLKPETVQRLERRARERGLSPNAALEELVESALPAVDPVAGLEALARAADRKRGGPAAKWRGFTKDELHEDEGS